jgi:mRNA interferase HigB
MRVIKVSTLKRFWQTYSAAEEPLRRWIKVVRAVDWTDSAAVKRTFGTADFIGNQRFVFDIGGNKFRIVAVILYRPKLVLIKFVGTHVDYDTIDPQKVDHY